MNNRLTDTLKKVFNSDQSSSPSVSKSSFPHFEFPDIEIEVPKWEWPKFEFKDVSIDIELPSFLKKKQTGDIKHDNSDHVTHIENKGVHSVPVIAAPTVSNETHTIFESADVRKKPAIVEKPVEQLQNFTVLASNKFNDSPISKVKLPQMPPMSMAPDQVEQLRRFVDLHVLHNHSLRHFVEFLVTGLTSLIIIFGLTGYMNNSQLPTFTNNPRANEGMYREGFMSSLQRSTNSTLGYLSSMLRTENDIPPQPIARTVIAKETVQQIQNTNSRETISVPSNTPISSSDNSSDDDDTLTNSTLTYIPAFSYDALSEGLVSGSNISFSENDGKLMISAASYPNLESTIPLDGTTLVETDNGIKLSDNLYNMIVNGNGALSATLTGLGLNSGGANDIWLHRTGGTLSGSVLFDTTSTGNVFKFIPRGDSGHLNGSGGAFFLDNSNNPGSGIGIFSSQGAEAEGNMINVTTSNSAFDQAAFYMSYRGNSNAVEIVSNANDISSNALSVTGFNAQDSTVGIIGYENGRGTVKISHYKNAGFSDANASGLSIDLHDASNGEQTSAQGIYVDSTATNGTLGNLLRLRNQTIDRFVVNRLGSLQIGASGTDTTITKIGNNSGDQFFVGTTGAFRVQRSAANSEAFRVQVNGDSQGRWLGTSDGQLKWGPGNVTQDTVLRRLSAGVLALEGGIVMNNLNADVDIVVKGMTDSNLFYVDSSADAVGIGTASPGSKLHVAGDLRVTGGFRDSSGDIGTSGQILSSTATGTNWIDNAGVSNAFVQNGNTFGANAVLGTSDGFPLIFNTNTTEAVRIDTSQQVGIGTSVPSTRLTVAGADLNAQADQAVGIANFSGSLTKNDSNTRTFAGVRIVPTINAGGSNGNTTINVLDVNTVNTSTTGVTRNLLRLADGGTTRFLVQSGGNVVATATTTTGTAYQYNFASITTGTGINLNVNALTSGTGITVNSSAGSNNMSGILANIDFTGNHAGNTGTIFRAGSTGASNTGTVGMITNLGTGLSFRVNDETGDADTTPFIVDNGGNVAIGATSVSNGAKLDVIGTVRVGTIGAGPSSNTLCYDGNNVLVACSSSERYKTNIESVGSTLDQIMGLRPVTFDWIANGQKSVGLIAEEVDKVNPLLVVRDNNGQIQSVRYDYLSALLAKGIQEQQNQINQLNMSVSSNGDVSNTAMASTSSLGNRVMQLETTMSDISSQIKTLTDKSAEVSSVSAELAMLKTEIETLRGQVLSASTSALLTSGTALSSGETTELDSLIVANKTNTFDLNVAGVATLSTLRIEGESDGSVSLSNLTGALKIQPIPYSNVEIMNNKVTIEQDGDLKLNDGNLVGNDNMRGINIKVDEGKDTVQITFARPNENSNYAVQVTPSWLTTLAVENKTESGFLIRFGSSAPADGYVDWLVVR